MVNKILDSYISRIFWCFNVINNINEAKIAKIIWVIRMLIQTPCKRMNNGSKRVNDHTNIGSK